MDNKDAGDVTRDMNNMNINQEEAKAQNHPDNITPEYVMSL